MEFKEIFSRMQEGKAFGRSTWPKGRFIWWMPGAVVRSEWCREPVLRELADMGGGTVKCAPAIRMFDNGVVTTGWTPSAADLAADDWEERTVSNDAGKLSMLNKEILDKALLALPLEPPAELVTWEKNIMNGTYMVVLRKNNIQYTITMGLLGELVSAVSTPSQD